MSDLTSPHLWGTGYGSKRHLVGARERRSGGWARCDSGIWLDFLADGAPQVANTVEARQPCTKCTRILTKEAQA